MSLLRVLRIQAMTARKVALNVIKVPSCIADDGEADDMERFHEISADVMTSYAMFARSLNFIVTEHRTLEASGRPRPQVSNASFLLVCLSVH